MAENTIIHEISLAGYKATSTGGMLDLDTRYESNSAVVSCYVSGNTIHEGTALCKLQKL